MSDEIVLCTCGHSRDSADRCPHCADTYYRAYGIAHVLARHWLRLHGRFARLAYRCRSWRRALALAVRS